MYKVEYKCNLLWEVVKVAENGTYSTVRAFDASRGADIEETKRAAIAHAEELNNAEACALAEKENQ